MLVQNSLQVIQVVRRFGPVGGMESYVWNLSRELVKLGCSVSVICEENHDTGSCPELTILFVKKGWAKPRWIGLLQFSFRVSRLIKSQKLKAQIIHSHERTAVHNVTTFHGPPFALIRDLPFWKWLSIRVAAHLFMESRELLRSQVSRIIPNSRVISEQLLRCYPTASSKLTKPIPPGVAWIPLRPPQRMDSSGAVIGFVGKEWGRKGLLFAIEIVRQLKKLRPKLELLVIGPAEQEIRDLCPDLSGALVALGWQDAGAHYQAMDLLLHPAKREPFGMVVIEAMAAQVPVVISDRCGACDYVSEAHGEVLPLESGLDDWVQACERQLNRIKPPSGFERGWDKVAKEYLEVYKSLT